MGLNFEEKKTGKIGDIVYPAHNGTDGFWKKPRWDLITVVDKEGKIVERIYIWEYATVKALELLKEFPSILHAKNREQDGEVIGNGITEIKD